MSADYLAAQEKARQQYEAAFHLLKVTFPVVKDPKLLMGVLHNLFSSLEAGMDAILAYERELQLLSYGPSFQNRYNAFCYRSVPRNKIPLEIANLLGELKELLDLHQHSPMEFQRGNKLVICSNNYHIMKTISIKELDEYLQQAKRFLELAPEIIRFK